MSDKVKFCKMNVDEGRETPSKYGITGIPTIILFKNGQVIASNSGSMSKKALTDFLTANL